MVKIAIAGGSGHIASEVIDVLAATKKHEIMILSRKEPATAETRTGVSWVKTDYSEEKQLTKILEGVHTVLSFTVAHLDPSNTVQKMLVTASIAAGVKRFAPSEWSSASLEELPWYAPKGEMREYLANINKDKKVLEYTLFQPGMLTDYVAPEGTSKHLVPPELWMDFPNRRAITLDGKEGFVTLTTMKDVANIVARAIEYTGEWPVVGGIRGTDVSMSKLLEIGIKVRGGKPWDITALKLEDVQAGNLHTSWAPTFHDPNLPQEQIDMFSKVILRGCLLSSLTKSWVVSDDFNRLFPDHKFADLEEFLAEAWAGKPRRRWQQMGSSDGI
ncbi:NAD(P)-binding protein [Mollisia scopiformis]|uniref:NAD(P)-binding protein n=1 Tax=Mollisia scopiformis TaxID=149040 RepID=A0A194X7F4_MOLSC|nr:NAD(P)-binding protein [Mollisia scopiformis]KUJ15737.1 NAD(P)-binding protein [Mollisia scopiformis]